MGAASDRAWRVVGRAGWRRAVLIEHPLHPPPTVRPARVPIEVGVARREDTQDYVGLRPWRAAAQLHERMDAGHRWFVARVDGRVTAARWVAVDSGHMEETGFSFPLAPDEAYVYDAFTAPAARRQGISRALLGAVLARLSAEGRRRALNAYRPEDPAGRALMHDLGEPIAMVHGWRLGPWHRAFARPVRGRRKPDCPRAGALL